ncbi:IGFALS [Branchiostoma lanceolatum]|uniref:IGFALS protein n=2 Tax=Branchiostoma lanceolatum TaxID=7740 RepID=A0A8J9YMQ6_BRALA|nr:IGFALS [Branchiostoma lanceolatum]
MESVRLCCYAVLVCVLYHPHTSGACPKSCFCFDLENDGYSVSCNGPNITTIPRDVPKNVTAFDISFTPITVLRRGDFVDMPKLKDLRVWWNVNLTMVDVGTFDNLPTLTSLGLYNNSFTKLPPGLFNNLKNLTRFDAHNCKLERIPRGLFTDHPSLEEILLFYNNIAELEEGAFGGLPRLTSVYLSSNRLTSLSGSIFEGSTKLTSLSVSDNDIVTIDNHVFIDTPNIEDLYLSANAIESIDVGAFYALQRLQSVSLIGNQITNIDDNFHNLPKLETISLEDNKISVILNTTFAGLPALTSLDLSYNAIIEVENGAFEDLSNLQTLSLQSNQIPEISLAGLSSLVYLYMDSNKLNKFPGDLNSANQLQTLSLDNNPIQESLGPGRFSVLHRLSNLYLSNISYLRSAGTFDPKALCGSATLNDLYLSYNGLITIAPTTFECTPTITMMYLHHNNLTSISPSLFHAMIQLHWLDLSYNQLSYMDPGTFLGLDKLVSVDLTGNNFTNMAHVAPAVASLPVLLYQSLDGNPFVYLGPESFPTPMKHATELDISHGHIRVVEEGAFSAASFPNITRLQLNGGNPLHFLPANIVDKLPNLTALILYDDPFHCDCQLNGFATWLRERINPPFVDLTCASPPSLQGKDLKDVPLANLTCDCQHEEAPSIDTSRSDTSVHEGQTAMLKCKISGCPEAEFFWTTPTGAMLAVESGFPRMEVLDSGTLVVTEAREEDTGVYTCTAVNYRGKDSKEVALVVNI